MLGVDTSDGWLRSEFRYWAIAVVAALGVLISRQANGQLTSGNLVVEQIGTTGSSTALSSSTTAVYLNQYSTTGSFINATPLPTAVSGSNDALTDSGSATSDGYLSRSADGLFIALPGYNAAVNTANITGTSSSSNARVVGEINGGGAVDTSRAYTFLSGNNFRSVASLDGTSLYAAGASGVFYTSATSGAGTSLTGGNTHNVLISNGNVFASTNSGSFASGSLLGIYQIGTGLPTATPGASGIVNIINTGSSSSTYAFQFNTAMNVAYIADDSTSTGGIQKWVLSGGTWTKSYTFSFASNGAAGARGLTVDWSNPSAPIIYATTADTSPNRLYSITDKGSVASSTSTLLQTAGANTIFRGVDQALLPAVYTGSAGGNFAGTDTTTYNATLGAVSTPYDAWSVGLVNNINLAFQNLTAAAESLNNNTSLTGVSSINFNGGGTIAGASATAYSLSGNALTLSGTAATSALGTSGGFTVVLSNGGTSNQTVGLPLKLGAANQAFSATGGNLTVSGGVDTKGFALGVLGSHTTFITGGITDSSSGKSGTVSIGNGSASSGTLSGTGTIAVPVTVNGGGTIAVGGPGGTVSTLTTGQETWNGGGTFVAKVTTGGASNDQISMGGLSVLASAGSPFSVTLTGTDGSGNNTNVTLVPQQQIVLAIDTDPNGTDAGKFQSAINSSAIVLSGASTVAQTNGSRPTLSEVDTTVNSTNVEELVVTAAPEPTSLLLATSAAIPLALRVRRRRPGPAE
jgi:hypothetical protein